MEDFVILGTYEGTVDDVEKALGEETANRMMWEIFTYGATGKREQEFPAEIECCLVTIQAKMYMSNERKQRTISKRKDKSEDTSAK